MNIRDLFGVLIIALIIAFSSYEFTSYMEYLTSNNLISIDSETGKYSLATHGERFLEEIESSGISMDKFSG